ncbi:hypothetical protein FVE85_3539 [Porphyridium purpureum]|uniref:Uncharacterized protein n=1 Tax=Porphyridium purpureum TaxID=35688 RepID=A0A5J4YKU6_PORPP|nr:hypothetical protein FVE85_3539 [Porphyridium purpureum]|eukprot:POR9404..scf249_10
MSVIFGSACAQLGVQQPLNPLPGFLGTPAPAPDQQESSPEAGANTPNPPELPETDPPQPESPPPQQTQPDAGNLQQPQSAPPPGPRAPGIVVPFLTVVPFDQLPPGGDGSAGGVGSEFDTSGLPPFGPSPDPGAGQFGPFSPLAPAPEPQPQPQPQPQPEPEPELEPEQDQGPRVQFQPLAQVLPRPNLEFGRR